MSFALANSIGSHGIVMPYPWSGPKEQQNKTDVFLSVYGVMHVIINTRKERGKELKEFILKDIIPRGLNEKIKQTPRILSTSNNRPRQ